MCRYIPAHAHPLNFAYILKASGRWNRPGVYGCLYTALAPKTALAELRKRAQLSGVKLESLAPRDLVCFEVTVEPVLDLSSASLRRRLGIAAATLTGDTDSDYESCRQIADWARSENYRAILAPSAADAQGRTLSIYPEGPARDLQFSEEVSRHAINYGDTPLMDNGMHVTPD